LASPCGFAAALAPQHDKRRHARMGQRPGCSREAIVTANSNVNATSISFNLGNATAI
jgi:hypothetical protein